MEERPRLDPIDANFSNATGGVVYMDEGVSFILFNESREQRGAFLCLGNGGQQ